MFLAISEMAVASRVESVDEKPSPSAICRPTWRAVTMSASAATRTRTTSATGGLLRAGAGEQLESFLEIERRLDVLERHAQLHHGERHFGLDPDDDGDGAPQSDHVSDRAECPCRKRIHHVEHR